MKRFFEWMKLKKKLDKNNHKPPYVSEGDIWWASVGENVGSEIGGKSQLFSRPVIIFKKLSHGFYFVIPTTTQNKRGDWYVNFVYKNKKSVAILSQAMSMDHRRLSNKIGVLSVGDLKNIKHSFKKLYCD